MRARILISLALLVACGGDDDAMDGGIDASPDAPDASPDAGPDAPIDMAIDMGPATPTERLERFGEHNVGVREMTFEYERPDGEGMREVELFVWYPTDATEGTFTRYSLRFRGYAFRDAPYAAGPFPTMVFSHGQRGLPDAASLLGEHFASHGYLVLSPRHVGSTTSDGDDRNADTYYLRPHDVSETLDFAIAHAELGPLAGTPRIISGHSFGGYTAFAVAGASYDVPAIMAGCADESLTDVCKDLDETALDLFAGGFEDDRFDLVIAMATGDSTLFGAGIADIDVPMLHMVAEEDGHPAGSADDDIYWTTTTGPDDMRIDVLGGGHNSFIDVCETFPTFVGCPDMLDPVDAQNWVRRYTLGFTQARLMGDAEAEAVLSDTPPAAIEITRR